MDFKVQQSPTTVQFIAVLENNNQLQIRNDTVDDIVSHFEGKNLKQDDPVVIISAVGPPSTRKTGMLNTINEQIMSYPSSAVKDQARPAAVKFPELKSFPTNVYNFDKILASTPIAIQRHSDGRRFGIFILDLCNTAIMYEDVYIKLWSFGFLPLPSGFLQKRAKM